MRTNALDALIRPIGDGFMLVVQHQGISNFLMWLSESAPFLLGMAVSPPRVEGAGGVSRFRTEPSSHEPQGGYLATTNWGINSPPLGGY